MATVLDYDIKFLPGVGEKRAGVLARELGIRTFGDLLYYFPFRYVDRTKLFRIGDIGPDAPAYIQVRARVTGMAYEGEGRKRRLRVFVSDGSGTADLVWFSGTKWIEKRIEAGREYIVFGRPALFRGELSFVHPEIDLVEALVNRPGGGLQGDYYIPCITLPTEKEHKFIGLWGQRYKRYLQEHKRAVYTTLLTSGKLNGYLADIDEQAMDMMFRLVEQMADKEGVTEQLKAENPMLWVVRMNEIQARAREIINREIIYT